MGDRFKINNMISIAERAFRGGKSLDPLSELIFHSYVQVGSVLIIFVQTDFTEDQRKLAEKGKYIVVYNKKREEFDFKGLNYKIDIARKKVSEI
ncbi:MAG: hypothetical protein ACYCSO_08345 [Cuniculiplasma sp.]